MASPINQVKTAVGRIEKGQHQYVERLLHMTAVMEAHVKADAEAFQTLGREIKEVNLDVKSLLASRSFLRGTWFAIVIACTFVAAVAGLVLAWYKP